MGNDLKQSLRRSLVQQATGKHWNVNPLIQIGLHPSILDLKYLTDEQLKELVFKQAVRVIGFYHTDQAGTSEEVVKLVGHYSQIYKMLQDDAIFKIALQEFRDMRNTERSEITEMRQVLASRDETILNLRSQLHDVQEQLNKTPEARLVEGRPRIHKELVFREPDPAMRLRNNQQGIFVGQRKGELTVCRDLMGIEQAGYILTLSFRFDRAKRVGDPELLDQAGEMYREIIAETRPAYQAGKFAPLQEFLTNTYLDTITLGEWIKQAKFNTSTLPTLHWGRNMAYGYLNFLAMHNSQGVPHGIAPKVFEPFELTRSELNNLYREGLGILTKAFNPDQTAVSEGHIFLRKLRVVRGYIWDRGGWHRLAGCVFPENAVFSQVSYRGDTSLDQDSVVKHLHPVLAKGTLLLRQRVGRIAMPDAPLMQRIRIFEDRGEFKERPYLTNHLVLGCVEESQSPYEQIGTPRSKKSPPSSKQPPPDGGKPILSAAKVRRPEKRSKKRS